jgi:DNA-directed RNA polymerase specialized sigma24 family protein
MKEVKEFTAPNGRIVRYTIEEFDVLALLEGPPRMDSSRGGQSPEPAATSRVGEMHPAAANSVTVRKEQGRQVEQVLADYYRADKFSGRAWQQLHDQLWIYAWKSLRKKLRDGEIAAMVTKTTRRSFFLDPDDAEVLRTSVDDRAELAIDVITRAMTDFQINALLRRRWSPEGGTQLTTYFLNTCAFHFPRVYRRWSTQRLGRLERQAHRYGIDVENVTHQIARRLTNAGLYTDARVDVALDLLNKQEPVVRRIYALKMRDLTHAEIAAELNLSTAAVESRVRRFNRIVRSWLNPVDHDFEATA